MAQAPPEPQEPGTGPALRRNRSATLVDPSAAAIVPQSTSVHHTDNEADLLLIFSPYLDQILYRVSESIEGNESDAYATGRQRKCAPSKAILLVLGSVRGQGQRHEEGTGSFY